MKLNRVYVGYDNPVVLTFSFTGEFATDGLSNFTDIQISLADETYTLLSNPANVIVSSNTELRLLIGDTTSLRPGDYFLRIVGVSPTYDDGYVLTACGSNSMDAVSVFGV